MSDRPEAPESGHPSGNADDGPGRGTDVRTAEGKSPEAPIETSPSGLPILPPEDHPRRRGPLPGSREEMRWLKLHSNWVNMIIATVACLGTVLVVLAVVPRSQSGYERVVDASAVAQAVQPEAGFGLAVLDFGEGWHSNAAEYGPRGPEDTLAWYQSVLGPDEAWATVLQTEEGNDAFLEAELDEAFPLDDVELAGWTWQVYERQASSRLFYVVEAEGVLTILTSDAGPEVAEQGARTVRDALESHSG